MISTHFLAAMSVGFPVGLEWASRRMTFPPAPSRPLPPGRRRGTGRIRRYAHKNQSAFHLCPPWKWLKPRAIRYRPHAHEKNETPWRSPPEGRRIAWLRRRLRVGRHVYPHGNCRELSSAALTVSESRAQRQGKSVVARRGCALYAFRYSHTSGFTTCSGCSPRRTPRTASTTRSPMHRMDSRVWVPMCGVPMTLGRDSSGLPAGGSVSKTSVAYPATFPETQRLVHRLLVDHLPA